MNDFNLPEAPGIDIEIRGVTINAGNAPGATDHAQLKNRDAADQHPIDAISGLREALKELEEALKKPGAEGTSIADVHINENGYLLITYSTGEIVNVGKVVGEGKDGTGIQSITINDAGELGISLTDGSVINLGRVVGADGAPGEPGPPGETGPQGEPGTDGKSAYEIALDKGFEGTEQEWLASLKGDTGVQGKKGDTGETGPQGPQGPKGDTGETGPQGPQGVTGERGAPFSVAKIYHSVAEMNAGYSSDEVLPGEFVVIDTGNVEDEDNAKLFIKGDTAYRYITDMSGAQGMQGPQGIQGIQGIQGPQGDKGTSGSAGIYIRDPDTETVEDALANAEAAGAVIFIDPAEEPDPEYATTVETQKYVDDRVGWTPLWLPSDETPRIEKGATVSVSNLYNYKFLVVTLADAMNPCLLEVKNGYASGGGMYLQTDTDNVVIRGIRCTVTNDTFRYDASFVFNGKNTTHASSSAALSGVYGIPVGGAFDAS